MYAELFLAVFLEKYAFSNNPRGCGKKGSFLFSPACVHGFCAEGPDPATDNFCICSTGWKGAACDQCMPYWGCPEDGTCNNPNECICSDATNPLCSHAALNPTIANGGEATGGIPE